MLVLALRCAHSEVCLTCRAALDEVAGSCVPVQPERRPLSVSLSDRQIEVLQLLADGFSIEQIAERMFVCPSTAKKHLLRARVSLGVTRSIHAVAVAMRMGLIS